MDHMRISGTEPSSVILSQMQLLKKMNGDAPKVSLSQMLNDILWLDHTQ